MTARVHDGNGWMEVRGNPLSKVGVYDYSGGQIGAPAEQAAQIFKVYRPASELSSPETIASFKLVPFISDHTMLGHGFTSTDERPVAGVVGEDVYFEGDTLYGNIKAYSPALAEEIKSGKTELSCGYRCRYEFTPGVFNGETYDVIQRTIRGNHLALVDEGRMGPEVSILDQLTFTVDAKEPNPVDEILAALKALSERIMALEASQAEVPPTVAEEDAEVPAETAPAEPAPAADTEAAPAADADTAAADAALAGRLAALEGRPAMDEATMLATLAKRSALVERLSAHVGTFDSAAMTTQAVAEYGVTKLKIAGVPKGHEVIALDAFLQAKPSPTAPGTTTAALDSAPNGLAQRIKADHNKGAL